MSKRIRKHDDGYYRISCHPLAKPEPTRWQNLLATIHMREEEALMAVSMPRTLAARLLREELRRTGLYHRHYVPEAVIEAFGWKEEVERRMDGDWFMGRPPKPKVRRMPAMPLLDEVKG